MSLGPGLLGRMLNFFLREKTKRDGEREKDGGKDEQVMSPVYFCHVKASIDDK